MRYRVSAKDDYFIVVRDHTNPEGVHRLTKIGTFSTLKSAERKRDELNKLAVARMGSVENTRSL